MPEVEYSETALTQLAHQALKEWDLDVVDVTLHSQRENTVYRIEAAGGEVYALRIHRDGYHDLAALESEHVWTSALATTGLSVPLAVETLDGRAYATLALPNSEQSRHIGLVKWIGGITLDEYLGEKPDASEVSAVYESLGQLTADLHAATSQWTAPASFKRHAWDAEGLVGEQPFWGRFWEIEAASDDERTALLTIRNRLLAVLSKLPRDADVFSMIHADLNADNVLRDGDKLSVIDFDDAGFGWHAFDLAVTAWDRMDVLNEYGQFELAYEGLLRGYRSRRIDCEPVLEQVSLFLLIRTLMLLRWMQDRPEVGYTPMIPSLVQLALAQAQELDLSV